MDNKRMIKEIMERKQLVGKRIKELRQAKGMTQEELADKVEISPKYLSSIERGKENPTFDTFIKLAQELGVEILELFNYAHERSSEELRSFITELIKSSGREQLELTAKIVKAIYL